jgi:hypothetical protein
MCHCLHFALSLIAWMEYSDAFKHSLSLSMSTVCLAQHIIQTVFPSRVLEVSLWNHIQY